MVEPAAEYWIFEHAAARNLLDYVTALRSIAPGCADAIECAGGTAAFTGIESPLTVVKGVDRELSESDIDQAEAFFQRAGASRAVFELTPWAALSSRPLLVRRGYAKSGAESVVIREVPAGSSAVSMARVLDAETWGGVFREVSEVPPVEWWVRLSQAAGLLPEAVNLAVPANDGGWIACAQLAPSNGVAILGNDFTLGTARGRGIQKTLIRERLNRAAALGLRWALAEVEPESASEANYVKCGFHLAYARAHYAREFALG